MNAFSLPPFDMNLSYSQTRTSVCVCHRCRRRPVNWYSRWLLAPSLESPKEARRLIASGFDQILDPKLKDDLYIIVSELVTNAVKAATSDTLIWLSVQYSGSASKIEIHVEDTNGNHDRWIPPEADWRAKGSDEMVAYYTTNGGIGLGLYISKKLVALNSGTLSVRRIHRKDCQRVNQARLAMPINRACSTHCPFCFTGNSRQIN